MGPFRGSSPYQRTGSSDQDDNNGDSSSFGNNILANRHSQDYEIGRKHKIHQLDVLLILEI